MEIKITTYTQVKKTFGHLKPDLLDKHAIYTGCYIKSKLIGIVSYVEHEQVIYLCHDYVLEEHRNKGVYRLLNDYRNMKIKDSTKTIMAHCNPNSLKYFLNNGYEIEKPLFKVVKIK